MPGEEQKASNRARKITGRRQRQEDHGEHTFEESEPKWSDRSPLNSGFTAPRAPVSASSVGQLIGDSMKTRSCAPTAQRETMHKRV